MSAFKAPFSSFPVGAIIRQGMQVFKKTGECEYGPYNLTTGHVGTERFAEPWDQFMGVDQEWIKKRQEQKDRQKKQRQGRDEAMRTLGMRRVKGGLGGTYWE
jgi:hypothetical protein